MSAQKLGTSSHGLPTYVGYRTVQTEKVWSNPKLAKIEKVQAIIPVSLVFVMRQIEKEVPSVEFGIYLHGEFNGATLKISEDYLIPKQKVSMASIDFEEDGHENGCTRWNGVAHKHPTGCKSFSGTDDDSINGNHQFSLLYENGDFANGEVNLNVQEMQGRIRLPLAISYLYPKIDIPEDQLKNISRSVTFNPTVSRHQSSHQFNAAIRGVEEDPDELQKWESYLATGMFG